MEWGWRCIARKNKSYLLGWEREISALLDTKLSTCTIILLCQPVWIVEGSRQSCWRWTVGILEAKEAVAADPSAAQSVTSTVCERVLVDRMKPGGEYARPPSQDFDVVRASRPDFSFALVGRHPTIAKHL